MEFSKVGATIETDAKESYRAVVEGLDTSFLFLISNESYEGLVKLLASGLYHQRCGIDRDMPHFNLPKPLLHVLGVDGF